MTPRERLRAVAERLAPTATAREIGEHERELIKVLAVIMAQDGFTKGMTASALEMPPSTLHSWAKRDDAFGADLNAAYLERKGWLLGKLIEITEFVETRSVPGGSSVHHHRAVGPALNILANLWMPELRGITVDATVSHAPEPGESEAFIVGLVNKGRTHELVESASPDDDI